MYALIKTGGKQYRVAEGQTLKIETVPGAVGETVYFDHVMMVVDGDKITLGTPIIPGHKVAAEVVSHGRHKKVHIIKFRRRKHYMRRQGHRQNYTEIKITALAAS